HAIRAAAEDDAVGLVVMGSHGRRGVDRWVLGSVAARVVQRAPKPVLVVRHELPADRDQGPPMRSILLATDFSERAAAVEAEVIAWAKRFGAEVEVLHVIRETSVMLAPYAVTGSSDFEGEMFEAAASRMQGVLRRLAERGVHAKSKIVYGLPSEEILRRAEATNVDLVAMGTRGYSGLQRFFLGSVAQRVLSQARCDVLVAAGNDALAESHETEARFVAAAADPIAHTTARVEAVVAAVDAEPLETREPVRSAAAPTAPAVPAVTASVPLATAITTPAAPAETTPYADPDDDWVPPRAEDLTDRLFALVMAGVLGVILAFSIAAAGI
ncbi:MAG: universal stress protein, partial [Myxococcota bacterium]